MNVRELHDQLTELYPKSLSCPWDNDGIMLSPDLTKEVKRVLVALDATGATLEYAVQNGFDTVVTHHPMIFKGLKSVTECSLVGRRVLTTALAGVSVISFHTRFDAADGGVNDALCSALGYTASEKFGDDEAPELGRIIEIGEMTALEFACLVKEKLGCDAVRVNGDLTQTVKRVGLCGGNGEVSRRSREGHGTTRTGRIRCFGAG